jgi:hypothetical protein
VLPQFVPSAPLTIPTNKLSAQGSLDGTGYNQYPSNPFWQGNPNGGNYWTSFVDTEFNSSYIEPTSAITTVQMTLDGYTGTIKAQAAENYQSLFYNVTESTTYYNETRTIYMNIVGWYPIIRLCFNNSIFAVPDQPGTPALAYATVQNGQVQSIEVTNGGSGYLAPPKVNIIGEGAGATAEATVVDGVVTSIQVTNPGSGYWYLPNPGVTTATYPVPPNSQGAIVVISTGYVVDLLYR